MSEIVLIEPTKQYAEQIMAYRNEMLENKDSFDGCAGLEEVHSFESQTYTKICRVLQGFIDYSGHRNFVSVNHTIGIPWQTLFFAIWNNLVSAYYLT